MSRSYQKSKANDQGNKKHTSEKKFEQGCLSNWCDADADADVDADSSKTICRPPLYQGGRHKYQNMRPKTACFVTYMIKVRLNFYIFYNDNNKMTSNRKTVLFI